MWLFNCGVIWNTTEYVCEIFSGRRHVIHGRPYKHDVWSATTEWLAESNQPSQVDADVRQRNFGQTRGVLTHVDYIYSLL